MEEDLAYCGLICRTCAIHLAAGEEDPKRRQEMRTEIARQIEEHYGQECKPEDVGDCDGCKADTGRLFAGCRTCQMRKCAMDKGIESWAYCDDYPCEALEKLFATDAEARKRLDAIRREKQRL
jgi:hypothetical protein